jgi:hypothetical protein
LIGRENTAVPGSSFMDRSRVRVRKRDVLRGSGVFKPVRKRID